MWADYVVFLLTLLSRSLEFRDLCFVDLSRVLCTLSLSLSCVLVKPCFLFLSLALPVLLVLRPCANPW
jgi:hypothetical protein